MTMDEIIREVARRIVETVRPRQIILFGSAARGEMGPDSDLDVLVILPEHVPQRAAARAIYRNLIGVGFAVDVVVATPADIAPDTLTRQPLLNEALTAGRVIYAA